VPLRGLFVVRLCDLVGRSRPTICRLCEPPHTRNAGKILDNRHETLKLQAIGCAHGKRFHRPDKPDCYRSAYRGRTAGRKLERAGGPGGLRPVLRQDRVPDKAREVALARLHHLIESIPYLVDRMSARVRLVVASPTTESVSARALAMRNTTMPWSVKSTVSMTASNGSPPNPCQLSWQG
jgi:hypothetical protein